MAALFLFGTLWFWLLSIASFCLIVYFLEDALSSSRDDGGGFKATIVLIVFGLVYYFWGSSEHVNSIFNWIKTHTTTVVFLFLGYIVAGVVWAFAKWFFFLLNKKELIKDRNWNHYGHTDIDDYIPKAKNNKSRIMSWMMYWPFSGIWTLINDPVKKAFQVVYSNIESYFDGLSQRIFADEKKKFEASRAKKTN